MMGGLLLAAWAWFSSERLGRIHLGWVREFTLPGAADNWPTRSQDLAGWPLWLLPVFVGAAFAACGLALFACGRELGREEAKGRGHSAA